MTAQRRFWLQPPWHEEQAVADRLWRTVIATLGRGCDELWLCFGNPEELQASLSDEDYRRLDELVGPYWGVPDPASASTGNGAEESLLDLQGLADALAATFGATVEAPETQSKYPLYGFAVVPLTPELLQLVINLRAVDADSTREMLSRLSDHWHFRSHGRDVVTTNDGMAGIGLNLTEEEVDALVGSLASVGLSPQLLTELFDAQS